MAIERTKLMFSAVGQTVGATNFDALTYAVPTDRVIYTEIVVLGRTAGFKTRRTVRQNTFKNVSGTTSEVGTSTVRSDQNNAGLEISAAVNTPVVSSPNIIFRITGVAGHTIDWWMEVTIWLE